MEFEKPGTDARVGINTVHDRKVRGDGGRGGEWICFDKDVMLSLPISVHVFLCLEFHLYVAGSYLKQTISCAQHV